MIKYAVYIHIFILQEGYMYVKWLGLLDKQGRCIYAASSREKIVLLGDTPQDILWGEKVPLLYQAALAEKLLI